jgi:hypothetical protein
MQNGGPSRTRAAVTGLVDSAYKMILPHSFAPFESVSMYTTTADERTALLVKDVRFLQVHGLSVGEKVKGPCERA